MKFTFFVMALLMSFSLAFAFPVDITYTDSSSDGKPIVADVPFDVTVLMNTNNNEVLSYNLYVTSSDARAIFTSASRGQLFSGNDLDANSGSQLRNTIYRYQVKPKVGYVGNSAAQAVSIFTLRTKISDIVPSTVELKRREMAIHADNVITPAESGVIISAINDATTTITPVLSTCGDGVVGYVDANSNGIKDTNDINEACDEGVDSDSNNKNYAAGGCSAQCTYIDLGYSCDNAQFGDRGSVCIQLSPKEFLIQKLTALIDGRCYPNCNHPTALYLAQDAVGNPAATPHITYDVQSKLDLSEKIYLLAQIGAALREFFTQTVPTTASS